MSETADRLYSERYARLERAIHLEKNDKIPVIITANIPIAKMADPEIMVADALERPKYFIDKSFEGLELLDGGDAITGFTGPISKLYALIWLSKVKLPGVELGRDDMVQFVEDGKMKYEDYDVVLNKGWGYFRNGYITNVLDIHPNDEAYEFERKFREYAGRKFAESGYVDNFGWASPFPWDWLTSLRGLSQFFRDLKKEPEKIKAVLDVIYEETLRDFKEQLKVPSKGIAAMVQPGVRSNCDFISRNIYEKFVWPYTQGYGDAVLEAGHYIFFHYDANWDLFLDFFTYFPAKKCIFDTDGLTDIYKVKEILGGRMAITGNVPGALLVLGTPDQVYDFVKKQINDLGADGYIGSSACGIPTNAKAENIIAMVDACK